MLSSFPSPYPDELFYSIICRYHVRSANQSSAQTRLDVFGSNYRQSYLVGLPRNLAALTSRLPYRTPSAELISIRHTLFPYYQTFLTPREIKRLQGLMSANESQSLTQTARIPPSPLYHRQRLRYCPQCLEEDLKLYGEAYWHRWHQAPGIEACLDHGLRLQDSRVAIASAAKNFIPASISNCCGEAEETASRGIRTFSHLVASKVKKREHFGGLEALRRDYRQKLTVKGWMQPSSRGGYELNADKLVEALLDVWGTEASSIIHPEMAANPSAIATQCWLGCDLLPQVDRVAHWLLEGALLQQQSI